MKVMDGGGLQTAQVLEAHRTMLLAYLVRLTRDFHAAEDVVQEVYAEVLANPRVVLRGDDVGAYLRGIARHLASRHFRQPKAGPLCAELLESAWERAPIEEDPRQDASFLTSCREALRGCLEALPPTWRRLFDHRYAKSGSYAAIADAVGMTSPAVRMTMTRIRRRLADCVSAKMGEQIR